MNATDFGLWWIAVLVGIPALVGLLMWLTEVISNYEMNRRKR